MMDDEKWLAAHIGKDLGIVGLALLVLLNAGGLGLMVAIGGSHVAAAGFIGGVFFALLAMLISYLLAEAAAAGASQFVSLSPGFVLAVQLIPALLSAAVFFRCAFRALQALS